MYCIYALVKMYVPEFENIIYMMLEKTKLRQKHNKLIFFSKFEGLRGYNKKYPKSLVVSLFTFIFPRHFKFSDFFLIYRVLNILLI